MRTLWPLIITAALLCGCRSHSRVTAEASDSLAVTATHRSEVETRDTATATADRRVEIAALQWTLTADSLVTPDGATIYRPRLTAEARDLRAHQRQTSETAHAETATTTDSVAVSANTETSYHKQTDTAHTAVADLRKLILSIALLLLMCFLWKLRKK